MKTCKFDGCPNHGRTQGLCDGHYSQQRRGIPLRPLKTRTPEVPTEPSAEPIAWGTLWPQLERKEHRQRGALGPTDEGLLYTSTAINPAVQSAALGVLAHYQALDLADALGLAQEVAA